MGQKITEKQLEELFENKELLNELLRSDLPETEKQEIMKQIQQMGENRPKKEATEAEKAANMLAQLEADMNPKAIQSDSPSINGMEIMNEDGTIRVVKVGRNDLCPCGSGKKYKRCCGK